MEPEQLLRSARRLADLAGGPTQEDLRRAVSAAYYALFHTLSNVAAPQDERRRFIVYLALRRR